MAAPATSTSAPWCTTADLPAKATDGAYDLDLSAGGEVADWIQVASDVLFNLTRRRWPGATSRTIRPIIADWSGFLGPPDTYRSGTWVEVRRGTTITADGVSEIVLPHFPIVSITEVKIDGAVVDASRYRVDQHRRLVYLPDPDGGTRTAWPSWQDLDQPSSALGTFEITYVHGTAPPEGGKRACAELATELAIAASPKVNGQARLPQRLGNVTRQGVSATAIDPISLFDDGKTGINAVDLWVMSVNRGAERRRGRVRRLGHPSARRPT